VVDCGDVPVTFGDGRRNAERARTALQGIVAQGTVPLVIGGDDSIPPMVARALAEQHRFHVVTVDAHLDFRDEVEGEREGRSSPARRMLELAGVLPRRPCTSACPRVRAWRCATLMLATSSGGSVPCAP